MNYKITIILPVLFLTLCGPLPACAGCTLDGFAADYMEAYRNRGLIKDCYFPLMDNMDKARRAQLELVALMERSSRRAGYKVGLTDSKAREMFGISRPLVGVLFKQMLLQDGADVALDSATSLMVELDLLVRVKSAGINQAGSVEDAARHIDAIIPFIELPDAMFRRGSKNAAGILLAGNVGARWGVTGDPVTVVDAQDLVERLPEMALRLSTDTGEIIHAGRGERILEHPLNSVLYLLKELALRDEGLKQGDLVSLGAIGGPVKAEQGRHYTAEYSGYGDRVFTVSVTIQ